MRPLKYSWERARVSMARARAPSSVVARGPAHALPRARLRAHAREAYKETCAPLFFYSPSSFELGPETTIFVASC